jgi:hypothetical protein
MSSHLIYHPRRNVQQFDGCKVYFDRPRGNQDPYIWNDAFLHTYCHMTELTNPQPEDINFWMADATFRDFNHLFCDLVFVIAERKEVWEDKHSIKRSDPIVDSDFAFRDHYRWVERQHRWPSTKRQRITLKADPMRSFQPQTESGSLIDVLPFFADHGLPRDCLRTALRKPRGERFVSKPMPIDQDLARELHEYLSGPAHHKLDGALLRRIRQNHPELESPC